MSLGVNNWSHYKLNFRVFANRLDFIQKGKDANAEIKRKYDPNYRGLLGDLLQMENVTLYEDQTNLKYYLDSFEEIMAKIDMGGAFKKTRLRITDDKRGIFDFGLASKGLQRAREYYSKKLATDSPREFMAIKTPGLVPEKFVKSVVVLGQKQFWYESKVTGEKYLLELRQEGTTKAILENPTIKLKITNGMLHPEKHVKGLKFKTTNKKSYLMFEKKGGKAKMVELYLPLHGSIYLQHVIPLLLVARFLKLYGVMTRISTIRMYHERGSLFVAHGYPIKDYGDELDFNWMALNSVDQRWWHSVRTVIKNTNDLKIFSGDRTYLGRSNSGKIPDLYDGAGSEAGSRSDYIEVFSRYRNWYMEAIKSGELPPLRVDKKLMLIGGAFGVSGSLEGIKKEFFRILDTVDFQFNNPEDTCKRIYKREVDEKVQEWYSKNINNSKYSNNEAGFIRDMDIERANLTRSFKTYVQSVLTDTYTYPIGGQYAEPDESAKKLDEEMDEKLEKMSFFLKSI